MVALLDANLLIALAWPNHVHHGDSHRWFRRSQSRGWATCPLTQSAFVRVSSNRRVFPAAKRPAEAKALLLEIISLPHHVFWPDDLSIVESDLFDWSRLVGYRQVSDGHVLAIALRHGGRLATLDSGLRDLVPSNFDASERVEVVMPR